MAYVLEYTSRHYQRRKARRNAILTSLGILLCMVLLVGLYATSVARRPTFRQIVATGYQDRVTNELVTVRSYQSLADRAFALRDNWDAAAVREAELVPYLGLLWSAVPVTNLVKDVAAILASPEIHPLDPVGFTVHMADVPEDQIGATAEFQTNLTVSIRWRTTTGHDEDTAAAACAALSNLFASASSPDVATNAIVLRVDFPEGNRANLNVVSEYAFPTIRRMPRSANLAKVTDTLRAFHEEIVKIPLLNGKKALEEKPTLEEAYNSQDLKHQFTNDFAKVMDPGAWMDKHPIFSEEWRKLRAVTIWNSRVDASLPWERGLQRKILSSKNFYSPLKLQKFLDDLPSVSDFQSVVEAYGDKCAGLTNALDNASFIEYDLDVYSKADHITTNLLDVAAESILIPTNYLLRIPRPGEELVLAHPSRKFAGGVRFLSSEATNRYAFARWTYTFASTNAPVDLSDLASGLAAFAASGQGYAPAFVQVDLQNEKGGHHASRVDVNGLLPVRLRAEEQ